MIKKKPYTEKIIRILAENLRKPPSERLTGVEISKKYRIKRTKLYDVKKIYFNGLNALNYFKDKNAKK